MAYTDQARLLEGRKVRTVFDLGANTGETVAKYRDIFPEAEVHAFEPIPELVEQLEERFSAEREVRVVPAATAAAAGELQFHMNEGRDTSSLLTSNAHNVPESYRSIQATKEVLKVKAVTIDDYCLEHGIESIDLLKLDIQGGEQAAFSGAERMLSTERVGVIYTEAFVHPFYQNQPLFGDLCMTLGRHGYVLHNLYNFSFRSSSGRCAWLDAIFVPPSLRPRSLEILNKDLSK